MSSIRIKAMLNFEDLAPTHSPATTSGDYTERQDGLDRLDPGEAIEFRRPPHDDTVDEEDFDLLSRLSEAQDEPDARSSQIKSLGKRGNS